MSSKRNLRARARLWASRTMIVGATGVLATSAIAPLANAQDDLAGTMVEAAQEADLPSIPGVQQLPNSPGLGATGGAISEEDALSTLQSHLPGGASRDQIAKAPADGNEASTNPDCAPNMFVGVPGTWEINRDDDPNQPVGLLGQFVEPIKGALGDDLSMTFVNYDADAGVNGTAYLRSVDGGKRKTLATLEDIAERCGGSQIFLAGFSQGAEIAGDIATDIGQRRTAVDPGTVGGVVLFSDPKRSANTNIIAGTDKDRPLLPQVIEGAVDQLMNDPSLAQLRATVEPINAASRALGGGDLLPGELGPQRAGGAASTTAKAGSTGGGDSSATSSKRNSPGGGGEVPSGGGDIEVPSGGVDIGGGGGVDVPSKGVDVPSGGVDVPSGGVDIGGGRVDVPSGNGGALKVPGAALTTDRLTIGDGVHRTTAGEPTTYADWLPKSEQPDVKARGEGSEVPAVGAGDAIPGSTPGGALKVQQVQIESDTSASDANELAAQLYPVGGCEAMGLVACRDAVKGKTGIFEEEDPQTVLDEKEGATVPAALQAALDEGEGEPYARLEQMCGESAFLEACAGFQIPEDFPTGADARPDDATALVVIPSGRPAEVTPIDEADAVLDEMREGDRSEILWQTPENSTAVERIVAYTELGNSPRLSGEEPTVPEGVTSLYNPATGETKPLAVSDEADDEGNVKLGDGDDSAAGADEAKKLSAQGWLLGPAGSDDDAARSEAAAGAFAADPEAVGGDLCGELALRDCMDAVAADSGEPQAAVPTALLEARASEVDLEEAGIPADYEERCLTLTREECVGANAVEDVPSLPEVNENAYESGQPANEDDTKEEGDDSSKSVEVSTPATPVVPGASDGDSDSSDSETSEAETSTSSASSSSAAEESTEASSSSSAAAAGEESTTAAKAGEEPAESSAESTSEASDAESTGESSGGGISLGGGSGDDAESTDSGSGDDEESTSSAATSSEKAESTEEKSSGGFKGAGGEAGDPVSGVENIEMSAVAGGGMSGERDTDFGDLAGRVVSPCVPGDIVCSLPEDSELAQSLVEFGKNLSVEGDLADAANPEGATRMGGMLAVQGVDTLLQAAELPRLKLSPETIMALVKLAGGAFLIQSGQPQIGAPMVASTIEQLPQALPEVMAQLQDIPAIIAGLPEAGPKAAENLGLVTDRVSDAFTNAGHGDPTNLANLPAMLPALVEALVQDNEGLLELATNPAYYTSGDKHGAFDTLMVTSDENALEWGNRWLVELGNQMAEKK